MRTMTLHFKYGPSNGKTALKETAFSSPEDIWGDLPDTIVSDGVEYYRAAVKGDTALYLFREA